MAQPFLLYPPHTTCRLGAGGSRVEEQNRDGMRQATQAAKGTGRMDWGECYIVSLNPAVGIKKKSPTGHASTHTGLSHNHRVYNTAVGNMRTLYR